MNRPDTHGERSRPRRPITASRPARGALFAALAGIIPLVLAGCVGKVPEEVYADGRKAYENLDFRKAEEEFAEFVHKYPDHELAPPAYLWLAKARARLGNSTGAIEAFRKAEEIAPEPGVKLNAEVSLIQLYDQRGEWDNALGQLSGLIASTTGDVQRNFIIGYGSTLWESGRVEDASRYFHTQAAEAGSPRTRGQYLLSLAELYLSAEDNSAAAGVLDGVIKEASAPENLLTTAYLWRGSALADTGRTGEAEENYKALQKRFPDTVAAAEGDVELAVLFLDKEPERSAAYLRAATEAFAERVREATESIGTRNRLQARIARAYYRVHRYNDALDLYEKIQKENPDDTVLQEQVDTLIQEVRRAMAGEAIPAPGTPTANE